MKYTKYDLLAFYNSKDIGTEILEASFIENKKIFTDIINQPVSFEDVKEEIEKLLSEGKFARIVNNKNKRFPLKYETRKNTKKVEWDLPEKPFLCEGSLFKSLSDLSLQTKKNADLKKKTFFFQKEIEKKNSKDKKK